jgi:two-component system sensor histidine kinase KdpD
VSRLTARARWVLWLGALLAATAAMVAVRARLDKAHVALVYLLVVLGASADAGRRLGLTVATAAFVLFNALFLPPYNTLAVANPLDWLVLFAFLITSLVAAQLLYEAQRQAAAARARADEVDRLAALGAESSAALGAERLRLAQESAHAEALRDADRMKDALLASVSHDLRTPLTTIKATAHEIAAGGDDRAAVIEAEADRLTRVVTDLLDLSRLRGGALHLDPQLTAADELLESVARAVAGVPGAERLRITLDPAEALLVGRFDLVHSARAVVELVVNALKYGGLEAPVDVAAIRDGEWLAVTVGDRGAGVAPSERERIFAPFYRGPGAAPDARVRDGTGLGLSIARQLATAQGGSLTGADRAGGGSVFTLRLPAADIGSFVDPGDGRTGNDTESL